TMEILHSGKRAILIPRRGPSAEQRMRAQLFADQGWVEMIDPDQLDAANVAAQVCGALARGPRMSAPQLPDMAGLTNAADTLLDLIGQPMPVDAPEPLIMDPILPALRERVAA
nr:hypothetical protein [Chloroflexota bacterium]